MTDDVLVVASHLPGEGVFRSERFRVEPVVCRDEYGYWQGLERHWESDLTIVNVEHDMEVDDEHLQALVDCPHPACFWAYRCHWLTTGIPGGEVAGGTGPNWRVRTHQDAGYLRPGDEWATWTAIGLIKVTPAARVAPLRRERWQRVEIAVEDAIQGPVHVHWPEIAHHHW